MVIEIDQSGKVEDTSKDTIIAFSNHVAKSILISAREKRELQKIFREIGKPRMFIYRVFVTLIILLLRGHLREIDGIIIDTEYPGWEHLIKDDLLRTFRRMKFKLDTHSITFQPIGKHSRAHLVAYGVAIKRKQADIVVKAADVLRNLVR